MSNQSKQPTILIKKSDGTSVRITLDEFKNMKTGGVPDHLITQSPDHPITRSLDTVDVVAHDLPMVSEEPGLPATTTPVVDVFVNEAASAVAEQSTAVLHRYEAPVRELEQSSEQPLEEKKEQGQKTVAWSPKDHESPLEESLSMKDVRTDVAASIPSAQQDVAEQVVGRLSFSLSQSVVGRAKALIQSRAKEIRTDEQVLRYATEDEAHGGLGLTPEQGNQFLAAIHAALGIVDKKPVYTTVQEEIQQHHDAQKSSAQAPAQQKKTVDTSSREALDALMRQDAVKGGDILASLRERSVEQKQARAATVPGVSASRPMVQDVTPPTPETMGPVDELKFFSLTDFRRLGGAIEQKKMIVLGKFETLKKDSFVLFMQGRTAWYQSPMYRQYLQIIARSINERTPVTAIISSLEGDHLSEEEFTIMTEISSALVT